MRKRDLLAVTRYLILIPVIGCLVAATVIFIYSAAVGGGLILHLLDSGVSGEMAKKLLVGCIEMVDMFLLGTALYIVSLGLYELFIDDTLALPHWLVIHDFDSLKKKLIGVVIVILAVFYLGQVETWDGERDLLRLGAGIALVIASLTWFLGAQGGNGKGSHGQE